MASLAELAIAALDDPDAAVVLEDFLLEHSPEDTEEHRASLGPLLFSTWPLPVAPRWLVSSDTGADIDQDGTIVYSGSPPTYVGPRLEHFPVVARCWVDDAYEFRVGMYANLEIGAPFYGIERSPDPQRLAGLRMSTQGHNLVDDIRDVADLVYRQSLGSRSGDR